MIGFNRVQLMGNLVADPSPMRTTGSGSHVCDIRVAVNELVDKDRERTLFIDVVCWGGIADTVAAYKRKGHGVHVEGHLEEQEWTDREKVRHRKMVVVAHSVIFLPIANELKARRRDIGALAPQED